DSRPGDPVVLTRRGHFLVQQAFVHARPPGPHRRTRYASRWCWQNPVSGGDGPELEVTQSLNEGARAGPGEGRGAWSEANTARAQHPAPPRPAGPRPAARTLFALPRRSTADEEHSHVDRKRKAPAKTS